MKAFRSLDRFDRRREFRPWLLAIVANEARQQARARGRAASALERAFNADPVTASDSAEEQALARIGAGSLLAALDDASPDDREVLLLRYVLELGERETAAILGCRPGTVKSRSARALARLRATLERSQE